MATPQSQAKTKSSQAKTKKRRPAADDPPTPGTSDPLLAELRETTTQRLAALLASNTNLLSDLGRLNSNGVDTGTVFGRALKRARGLETLVPPPPPEPEHRPRPVKCAASLHTSVIVDGAAVAFGFEPCGGDWRSPGHVPSQLPRIGTARDVAVACGWGFTVVVDAFGVARAGGRLPGTAHRGGFTGRRGPGRRRASDRSASRAGFRPREPCPRARRRCGRLGRRCSLGFGVFPKCMQGRWDIFNIAKANKYVSEVFVARNLLAGPTRAL